MNNYQNLSMDEIIFENRNKNYGAYELRQTIDRNATVGLLVTVSMFIALMLVVKMSVSKTYAAAPNEQVIVLKTQEIENLTVEAPKPKPPVEQVPPPKVNSTMLKDFKVVETVAEPQPVARQDELTDKTIGKETITDATASINPIPSEISSPTGTGKEPIIEPVATPTIVVSTILKTSEVLPSFPNGKDALMKYLRDNIHPYSSDIENGGSGKVIIRFYVDTDGTVKNPEVIKDGIGGRCGEAALYAIKKMPKWKPGLQNGTPVKVFFTLPVSFDFSR